MVENVLALPIALPVPIALDVGIVQVEEPAVYVKVIFHQQLYHLNVAHQRNLALEASLTLIINPIVRVALQKFQSLPLKI
ncbi:hypothetical protein EG359_14185 [Chryseobacterium joostei]|uniref:Uncharacterized protein n=1 Tax=Chryseobacterium joostei TaxID=112234 RepID=A0ABN5SCV9_9FLAO|nr:hypothetical protein EG359_14185 [Chryseobacterium joostei]